MKVSDFIFQFLQQKGIKHIFMLPGGGAMHLVDSVGKYDIEKICCQHEQAAAIAAESYGQHTNHIGVALVTSGPGATNAITGVTAGWIDSTPMLIISGQAKRSDLVGDTGVRQIGSQEVQIIDMVRPITKYAVQIMEPNEICYHLERAYYEATTGRPGPVWLSIPLDVQGAEINVKSITGYNPIEEKAPDIHAEVQTTVELLRSAKKPLLLLGNGIKLSGAESDAYRLMDFTGIPAQTTWKTIDMLGEDHPQYVGHPGSMGDRGANLILQEADLLISIGSRLDTSLTAFNEPNFAKSAKRVIVDIDSKELTRMHMEKEVSLACDAGLFLKTLNNSISEEQFDYKEWLLYCKELRKKYPVVTDEHRRVKNVVSAYYFIERLCQLLTPEDIIVPESSGGAGEITYQAFQVKYGQKMKNAAGLGSMGFGLPYSIGACLANDRRRTILINGDGAFQLNIQELETLHRLQLPVKIFLWDNGGYASIRSMQRNNFGGHYVASSVESGFSVPDTAKVAAAYGFKTYCIHNNAELDEMLPLILEDEDAVFCQLKTSQDEVLMPRVKAYKTPDGSMKSGTLEEMWPPA